MKEIYVKFCVGIVDTERPVDLTLMSLLLGTDGGNVVCKRTASRVVLWVFFLFIKEKGLFIVEQMSCMS